MISNQKSFEERLGELINNSNNNNHLKELDDAFIAVRFKLNNYIFYKNFKILYNYLFIYELYFNQKVTSLIAKELLRTAIYPTIDELRKAAKDYFNEYHKEFLKNLDKNTQWSGYYEKYVYSSVSLHNFHNLCIIFCKFTL